MEREVRQWGRQMAHRRVRRRGHEATDTGLAYAPVSQAHGHHHTAGGGGGAGELSPERRGTRCSPRDALRALPSLPQHDLRANWPLQLWAPPYQYQCGLPQTLQGFWGVGNNDIA